MKRFDARPGGLTLERVVQAPGGEDVLYVFYDRAAGEYVLMPYRVIAQKVEERIACHGFSLFADGHLLLFRADGEPQKHHHIQLRQTPFYQPGHEPPGQREAFLYRVGNKEVVRCLAEGHEVVTLARKESPYAELYVDLVKRCSALLDSHPWLGSEDAFGVDAALRQVREAADRAVDEFDKVRQLQREAVQRVTDVRRRCEERFRLLRRASFTRLEEFVENLSALRQLRGDLVSLKEVRYADLQQVQESEAAVASQADQLARGCVTFLLQPAALDPYRKQAEEQLAAVEHVTRVAEGRKIEKAVADAGAGLELLIETVNSLGIEDATETTRIIDSITVIYSTLNQVKAALKKRLQSLVAAEGAAQFAAQLKLLGQSASSYLDLCDTPAKCDEYLNRLTVQLEELEGAFADFEEYTVQLAEKRTSLYETFEQRKVGLIEQRTRRAAALMTAAERILKVIQNRLAGFRKAEEINGYMAADLMVAKVQEIIGQLLALGDPVRADDLQGRLKSARQDALRQLKDRQELFIEGQAVIQLGRHRFNVNTQPIDLTVVQRDGAQHLHVTATKYFEAIADEGFLATRDVWDQEVVSENARVYRAEYLAWRFFKSLEASGSHVLEETRALPGDVRLARLQEFMATRPQEGYAKGIHDLDAERIFDALLDIHLALQRAAYPPSARAAAAIYWHRFCPPATRTLWAAKLGGFAIRNRLFPGDPAQQDYIAALQGLIGGFAAETRLFPPSLAPAAGEYLFHELVAGKSFVVSQEAGRLTAAYHQHLVTQGNDDEFLRARQALAEHPGSELELVRDWVRGFLIGHPESAPYLDEVAALVFCGEAFPQAIVETGTTRL
ncbi:MAG TPA: DNA repair ATPase, partial [Thermoanaerobaculia bacterium]